MANRIKRNAAALQQKAREERFRTAIQASRQMKKLFRSPTKVLEAIYDRSINANRLPRQSGFYRIYQLFRNIPHRQRPLLYDFFKKIAQQGGSRLLTSTVHVNALYNIFTEFQSTIRPLEEWRAVKSRDLDKFLGTLLRHLFVRYEMPSFMDKAWTTNDDVHIHWYLHLGWGNNLRTAVFLPFTISKKAAHFFMQAPNSLSIPQALRWAQVRSLGGDTQLALSIATTRIADAREAPDFWVSVIRFLVKNSAELPLNQVNPIIDFIYSKKFLSRRRRGEILVPEQPNLSMKRRTLATLLTAVEDWHSDMAAQPQLYQYIDGAAANAQAEEEAWKYSKDWWKKYTKKWTSFGIQYFTYIEGTGKTQKVYMIRHLKTGQALANEGRTMSHCVGSYAYRCESGKSAIFTLKQKQKGGQELSLVTIEVSANKEVVQARAKENEYPDRKSKHIIRMWAAQNGLKINCYSM